MVSRRKILSRSRDNLADAQYEQEEEEDVWYNMDKLYKDHIQEVLDKWNQIDDEIWAKVIVFERNRRVAKAYARAPVLTVNGSNDGFDGFRIGLCGFDNPMRDSKTEEAKRHINQGVKIKMDEQGNILIKRLCKSNVYVKSTNQEDNAIGSEIIRNSQGALEHEKPGKLFDMNKFQTNLSRETRRAYPDRRRLETQCLSAIVFVRLEQDILQCPVWVLIVNVVGLDMLKSKLPPVLALQRPVDIKNRPRIPIPDEDPYSVAGASTSSGPSDAAREQLYVAYKQHREQHRAEQQQLREHSGRDLHPRNGVGASASDTLHQPRDQRSSQQQHSRRGERPPKLPPRENLYGHDIPKPDYDDIEDDYITNAVRAPVVDEKKNKKENNKKYDDPYYCGLRARVPNFVKMAKGIAGAASNGHGQAKLSVAAYGAARLSQQQQQHYAMQGEGHHPAYHHGYGHQHHQLHHHSAAALSSAHPLATATTSNPSAVANSKHRPSIMYHARSFESGLDSDDRIDSPYNHIYGRLPIPTRGVIPPAPRAMFIGEWD